MNLSDIMERGYFPKELPPPFNSTLLAQNITDILNQWRIIFENNTNASSSTFLLSKAILECPKAFKARRKTHIDEFRAKYDTSRGCVYSISKGKLSRRLLQIPNPKHFSLLSEKISNNWSVFDNIFKLSDYSQSYPVLETNPGKRSVLTYSKGVSSFRDELLKASVNKRLEIRIDISKFYPTIYTHSITWALLGKDKAKYYFKQKNNLSNLIASGDADASLYKLADEIDTAVRACQEKQSIGIPIGPDTSHIIAESITCRIDEILKTKFLSIGLEARRYYDDYYIYVSTLDEADKVLKELQLILSDFQLEINESKVRIKEFPFSIEDQFATALFLFDFKKTNIANSLKHYFSLIWGQVELNPKKADVIFKYSLRRFEFRSDIIPKKNWKLFEDLLFKTALIEPSILDIVTRILLSYKIFLDGDSQRKLKDLISSIIVTHSPVKHNFEVSWALWLAKTFGIDIEENIANLIIESKENISNLILLDMINSTSFVKGSPCINTLESDLKDDILFSENWLLAYESVKKGWLTPVSANLLDDNLFFKILNDLNIEFYNINNQLIPYSTEGDTKINSTDEHELSNKDKKSDIEKSSSEVSHEIEVYYS